MKLKIPGKAFLKRVFHNFFMVADLLSPNGCHWWISKVKNYNLNVTEILDSTIKNSFPGIFNFTVRILCEGFCLKFNREKQYAKIHSENVFWKNSKRNSLKICFDLKKINVPECYEYKDKFCILISVLLFPFELIVNRHMPDKNTKPF